MSNAKEVISPLCHESSPVVRRKDVAGALAITLVLQSTVSLLATAIAVLAPAITKARGWNPAVVALYAPLLYAGAFYVSFLVPRLLKRLGGLGLALCAVAACALGLACILSEWAAIQIMAPLFIGAGYGAMTPAGSHVLGPRTTANNAATIMSIKQIGVPMGAMFAGILLPFIAENYGWQQAAASTIVAATLIATTTSFSFPWLNRLEVKAPVVAKPLDPVYRLLAIPGMPSMLAATLIYTAVQLCLRSLLTTYLVTDVGFSLGAAGLALGISQFAGIFGQIIWAHLSDRILTPRTVMSAVGIVMGAGAFATASFSPNWPMFGVAIVAAIFGFSAGGFIPVMLGEVARHSPPGQVGALTSGANIFIISGAFIGPLAFGAISAIANSRIAFIALAISASITALTLLVKASPRQ